MFEKANSYLELIIKSLSLAFSTSLFFGAVIIWSYFDKVGLNSEVASIIGTPQVLILATTHSFLFAVGVVTITLLHPLVLNFLNDDKNLSWKNKNDSFLVSFGITIAPFVLIVSSGVIGIVDKYFLLFSISLIFLMSCVFYKYKGGPSNQEARSEIKIAEHLKFLSSAFVGFFLSYSLLLISILFFISISTIYSDKPIIQWLVFSVLAIAYSSFVAIAKKGENYYSFAPLTAFSLIILSIIFVESARSTIISKIGLSGFKASYSVEKKYLDNIQDEFKPLITTHSSSKTSLIKDVWVIGNFPNKIILSPSSESTLTYTLPVSAILGELSTLKAKPE